jgi:hypothetical protein
MIKRALVGLWTTSVLLTLNSSGTSAASGVVLNAAVASSTPSAVGAGTLPGTIEAENFDNGGEGIAYHDVTAGNRGGAYRQSDVDIEAATEAGYDVGWIAVGEWLTYSVNVATTASYLLEARVASSGPGGTFHVEFGGKDVTGAMTIPDTGGWQNWSTVSTTATVPAGPQIMRVVFDTMGPAWVGNLNWVRLSPRPSTPFTGSAIPLPGTVRANNFDYGGEGLAYHDLTVGNSGDVFRQSDVDIEAASEGGYDVAWIAAGEWLKYSVNVAQTGNYLLEARVASSGQGGTFHVEFDGRDVTGALTIPNTAGWQNWATVSTTVMLPAGPQIMRIVFDAVSPGSWFVGNFNWLRLSTLTSTPFTGSAISLPGTLRADNFDNGGEGLAYHDLSAGNNGGQYRNTDVDVERSSLGGYNVGWMDTGEWLAYTVNVTTAGSHTLQFQVASAVGGGQLHASFGSANTPAVAVPNTGGWQNWTTVSTTANLPAGPQVMKLLIDAGGFNVAGITIALIPLPPTPGPVGVGAPTTYDAISDRVARPRPALPALGPAGSTFIDPTFGSKILRVTDPNTRPNGVNLSYRSPSAGHQVGWNLSSTYFYTMSTDGTVLPFAFNASSMSASRIPGDGDGGMTLNFTSEPEFSATNPNVIYGVSGGSRTLSQYDFAAKAYSAVFNLDTLVSGLAGYIGGQASGGTTSDNVVVFFGGQSQDRHHYALWLPRGNLSAKKLLDTAASTLNGVPTNIALNFNLHTASIDRSGRYVLLYATGVDQAAPRYASQEYIWDTTTDIFIAITSGGKDGGPNAHPYGHEAAGFGYNVNQDCCMVSSWDAAQWQIRSFADPLSPSDLISPVQIPKEIYMADHSSWGNAQPDALVPVISATYRFGDTTTAWRAWDDEILGIETGAPAGAGATVWRFAHHRSVLTPDAPSTVASFWYTPRPNVSRNGRWVIFTSNWEKSLGFDPKDKTFRQDVFLVQLQ